MGLISRVSSRTYRNCNMNKLRALHYVFKIQDRTRCVDFLVNELGMTILRHEEFAEGCNATCNGAFEGRWSKSMIGYGSEDTDFVFEIVFNYAQDSYSRGNDFDVVKIATANKKLFDPSSVKDTFEYNMLISNSENKVQEVNLLSSNIEKTCQFWESFLEKNPLDKSEDSVKFDWGNVILGFKKTDNFSRGDRSGRTAFSMPSENMREVRDRAEKLGYIHTDLVELDTPGKATVVVVILQDHDGHEVCIVGDEAFRELSVKDPDAKQ